MSVIICESAIMQEAEIIKNTKNKARFRMVMQTADDVNRNKRMYPYDVLNNGMSECKKAMKTKSFYGEMDHPIPTGNDQFDMARQTQVLLKELSHYILDYQWDGNKLIGELETASTENGFKLHGLLKDKSGVGLSMRGMASLEKTNDYNKVTGPLTIVGFDAVSKPSHSSAVVNFNEIHFESQQYLKESVTETNNTICTPDGICYLSNYFDKLVEQKIVQFFDTWI